MNKKLEFISIWTSNGNVDVNIEEAREELKEIFKKIINTQQEGERVEADKIFTELQTLTFMRFFDNEEFYIDKLSDNAYAEYHHSLVVEIEEIEYRITLISTWIFSLEEFEEEERRCVEECDTFDLDLDYESAQRSVEWEER